MPNFDVLLAMPQEELGRHVQERIKRLKEKGDRAGTRGAQHGKDSPLEDNLIKGLYEQGGAIMWAEDAPTNVDLPDPAFKAIADHLRCAKMEGRHGEVSGATFQNPLLSDRRGTKMAGRQALEYVLRSAGLKKNGPLIKLLQDAIEVKTPGLTDNGALEDVMGTDLQDRIVPLPNRPIHLEDIVPTIQTDKAQGKYARETGYGNNIATVPYLQYDPANSILAPQVSWSIIEIVTMMKAVMGMLPMPENLYADIPEVGPALEYRLREGCSQVMDGQLLNGGGTGTDYLGLQNQSGIQTSNWSGGDTGDNQADALLDMIILLNIALYEPDTILLNNYRAGQLWKMKDLEDRYLLPVAHETLDYSSVKKVLNIWGLPIIRTEAQTNSTGFVGAIKSSCVLYLKGEAKIFQTPYFMDYISRQMLAVFIKMMGRFEVSRPEANGVVTFDHAPT